MIPFTVSYIRPETIEEATQAFEEVSQAGGNARYFAGGTEILTKARDHALTADALIDLKRIPETRSTEEDGEHYWFGASLRLNEVIEANRCALLNRAAAGVADHTVRNSVTLGGNIAGMLPYREAILPFLLFDGVAEVAGGGTRRTVALREVFDKRLRLNKGEFLVRLGMPKSLAKRAPTFYRRHTRDSRVDYPLATVCMAKTDDRLRFAASGAYSYPICTREAEEAMNKAGAGASAIADAAVAALPKRCLQDMRGSSEYRRALLHRAIRDGAADLNREGV
ncbi:MAG: FAD binding domain-containing protein [Spirochaetales bacterium]